MKKISANILLAHGSRDPQWQKPFQQMLASIRQDEQNNNHSGSEPTRIELAYMELCSPSLEETCHQLQQDGYQEVHIYPVFFAAGRHLRIDVPKQLHQLEQDLAIKTQLHPPIGQEKAVQHAITQVILQQM